MKAVFLLLATWLPLALTSALAGSDEAPAAPKPPRIRVAVLPFENATGDAAWNDWQQALPRELRSWLNSELITVRGGKRTRAALEKLGWTAGRAVDAKLAGQAAAELKADVVLWGQFRRQTNGWLARARVLRAGAEAAPSEVDAISPGWVGLGGSLALGLAAHLDRPIEEEERQRFRRYSPHTEEAAAAYAKAVVLEIQEAAAPEREKALRQVLALDPHCGAAHWDLHYLLETAGRWVELEAAARVFLQEQPECCTAHLTQACALTQKGDTRGAEREIREALRLHRGCPMAVWKASQLFSGEDLRALLEEAHVTQPDNLEITYLLAWARAQSGDFQGARSLLRDVDELPEEDELVDVALLGAALLTGDLELGGRELMRLGPKAAENEFIRDTLASITFAPAAEELDRRKILVVRPRAYSSEELKAELERRLSVEEQALVVNPIEITPEITAEARRLTVGLTNHVARAIALYSEVARRGRGSGEFGRRTASQALEAAADPQTRFSCQEHAKLFVALARSLGLEAWLVHVDRCADGSFAYHDCAALFLEGHGLLIDPVARAFGIWHEVFTVLDDVQAISHQAMQLGGPPPVPRRLRLGLKLNPDDRWTRLQFVRGMAAAGESSAAAEELRKVQAEGAEGWDVLEAAAEVEIARKRWKPALAALQRALELNPGHPSIHVRLASVYRELDDPVKQKEHTDAALRLDQGGVYRRLRQDSNLLTAWLGARALGRSTNPGDRQALERQAESGDALAQIAVANACFEARPPRMEEGMRWLLRAAEQGLDQAQRDYGLNLLKLRRKDVGKEAVHWLTRAANQDDVESQYSLGLILYEGELVPRDHMAAGQWMLLAAGNGHSEARRLLKEMELFLSADELSEARKRAQAFKPAPPEAAAGKAH